MTLIASYWFIWAGLFITFTALAIRNRIKNMKGLWDTGPISMMADAPLTNPLETYKAQKRQLTLRDKAHSSEKTILSGLTSFVAIGLLAGGSGILLAISIVVNIIDYIKLH